THARDWNNESDRRGRSRDPFDLLCRSSRDWCYWWCDRRAGGVGDRWAREPSGLSLHTQATGRVVYRLLRVAALSLTRRNPLRPPRLDHRRTLSRLTRRTHRSRPRPPPRL